MIMKKITLFLFCFSIYYIQAQVILNQPSLINENFQKLIDANLNLQSFNKLSSNPSKAVIWSSTMNTASQWTVTNETNATIGSWTWISDTSLASSKFKLYVHPDQYMHSTSVSNGLFYFDGITSLSAGIYGISNAVLKYNSAISTIGHPTVILKFYELYKAFNRDSIFVEISTNNTTWQSIPIHRGSGDIIVANEYRMGWYEVNISAIAGNQSNVWIRFRYKAPDNTTSGQQYSGGYGWVVDDISIADAPANELKIESIIPGSSGTLLPSQWNGYTQIPSGQNYAAAFNVKVKNTGSTMQNNLKVKIQELTTNTIAYSTTLPSLGINNSYQFNVNNFFNFTTPGPYLFKISVSSDSINSAVYKDTILVNVNTQGVYARDYNRYMDDCGNGSLIAYLSSFCLANLFQMKDSCIATSINFGVTNHTSVGAKVKAALYRGIGQNKTLIAETNIYEITNTDFMSYGSASASTITLSFVNGANVMLQKDSSYYAAVAVNGNAGNVYFAVDNSIPQPSNSVVIYDSLTALWSDFPYNAKVPVIHLNTLSYNTPYLITTPKSQFINFSAGSYVDYMITTNLPSWNATTNVNWLSLIQNIPTGTLTVFADSTYLSLYGRSANVIITGTGVLPDTILVYQSGTNFQVSPRNMLINSAASSTGVFDVSTYLTTWKAYNTDSWLSVTSDCVNKKINVTTNSANTSANPRYSKIIVQSAAYTLLKPILLVQKGTSSFIKAMPDTTFGYYGIPTFIDVMTDLTTWNATVSETYPFIVFSPDLVYDYIYVDPFDENPGLTPRAININLTGIGVAPQIATYIQHGYNTYFAYNPLFQTIADSIGSSAIFNIQTSNLGWSASCDSSWLNVSYNNATGKVIVTAINANITNKPRYAYVRIKYQGFTIDNLAVVQSPSLQPIIIYPFIQVLPSNSGATATFTYISTLNNLTFTSNVSWLDVLNTKSSGTITVTAKSPNITNVPRIAFIKAKGDLNLEQTITVIQSASLNVVENEINNISIYPNPACNEIFLNFVQTMNKFSQIQVYSITGKLISNLAITEIDSQHSSLNISSLSKGMYFIKIQSDKQIFCRKFNKE